MNLKPCKFEDVKISDVVCLNHYPYRPFKITWKSGIRLRLECTYPKPTGRYYSKEEFDAKGYCLSTQTEV